jgi:hypothetical protein
MRRGAALLVTAALAGAAVIGAAASRASAAGPAGAAGAAGVAGAPGALGQQTPARARLVFVWIDATTIDDWMRPDLPSFARLLKESSVSLLSAWSGTEARDIDAVRRSAAAEIALAPSGARAPLSLRGDPLGYRLGDIFAGSGHAATVLGSGDEGPSALGALVAQTAQPLPQEPNLVRPDPAFPTGKRTDILGMARAANAALATKDVVVIDTGDTARVERALGTDARGRAQWIHLSMRRVDILLTGLRRVMSPADTLIVASPTPSVLGQVEGVRLGALAVAGPGFRAGSLWSRTTRTAGLTALQDIPAEILDLFGFPRFDRLTGSTLEVRPRGTAAQDARELREVLLRAHRAHRPLTRALLLIAVALAALAFVLVASGRGRPPPRARGSGATARALPRGARDWCATAAIAFLAAPACVVVTAVLGIVAGAIAAVAFALGARAAVGRERALVGATAASAVVLLGDMLAGGALDARAGLATPVASGLRTHGADATIAGIVAGAAIFACALALDRARDPGRHAPVVLAGGAVVSWILAAPFAGDSIAAVFVVMPAVCVLVARALDISFSARALVLTVLATLIVLGIAVSMVAAYRRIDTLTPVASRHDLGPAIYERLHRARQVAFALLPFAALATMAPPAALAWRRREVLDRAMWGRPHARAAWTATGVAAAAAFVFLVAGPAAAAWIAIVASIATAALLVAPDPR